MHDALDQLPAEIGLLSMRRLVPVMAALPGGLNSYRRGSAAAVVLGARIAVSTESPLVTTAAASVGVSVDVVDLGL